MVWKEPSEEEKQRNMKEGLEKAQAYVYTLGSADPRVFSPPFSGVDIKVQTLKNGVWTDLCWTQGISFQSNFIDRKATGTILTLLSPDTEKELAQLNQCESLRLFANNEYGHQLEFVIDDFLLLDEKFGIGTDDLTVEINLTFKGKANGWKVIKE